MNKKRWLSIILVCCVMLLGSYNNVLASTNEPVTIAGINMKKNMTFTYYGKSTNSNMRGYENTYTLISSKISSKAENVSAVSSNKKVVTIEKMRVQKDASIVQVDIKLKKSGETKIKLTGTLNGKKITETVNVKVLKYKNPITSLRLNSKDYTSAFNKAAGLFTVKKSPGKYKISCKTASGWKIKNIKTIREYTNDDAFIAKYNNIKNNSIIKITKGQKLEIRVNMYNQKLKITESVGIVIKS